MTDTPPDRLSVNPASPHHNAALLCVAERAADAVLDLPEGYLGAAAIIVRPEQSALAKRDPAELIQQSVQGLLEALAADAVAYFERGAVDNELMVRSLVGVALGLSAGVTLYVAASDLIPEVNHNEHRNPTVSIVVFVGVALFYLLHKLIEG